MICFFFFVTSCTSSVSSNTNAKINPESIEKLEQKILQHEALFRRMQKMTADQIMIINELEQSIPPQDLLDSLQNGFFELSENIRKLGIQISNLEKELKTIKLNVNQTLKPESKHLDTLSKQEKIILGLISLEAGNPDQAIEYLQDILKKNNKNPLRAQILMALGNGFLERAHASQAAYYYGIILREYSDTSHVPGALYYLGEAMGKLAESEKQKILWKELIKNHPKSPLAKRAKKLLIIPDNVSD